MASEEEQSIEATAAARRERLKALRMAHQLSNTPDEDGEQPAQPQQQQQEEEQGGEDEQDEYQNVNMKFRNYLPHDKQLQAGKLAPPVLPKFEDPVAAIPPPEEKKEDPFLNIAPKKPNWDLRRDVQKKLDKLERRTQKAIFQLTEEEEKKRRLAEEES